jgi:hypothetical protein
MTRERAIEACARAIVKRHGYREDNWRQQDTQKALAADIVAALEALGLWKETS